MSNDKKLSPIKEALTDYNEIKEAAEAFEAVLDSLLIAMSRKKSVECWLSLVSFLCLLLPIFR